MDPCSFNCGPQVLYQNSGAGTHESVLQQVPSDSAARRSWCAGLNPLSLRKRLEHNRHGEDQLEHFGSYGQQGGKERSPHIPSTSPRFCISNRYTPEGNFPPVTLPCSAGPALDDFPAPHRVGANWGGSWKVSEAPSAPGHPGHGL